jgi:hypothetical protein
LNSIKSVFHGPKQKLAPPAASAVRALRTRRFQFTSAHITILRTNLRSTCSNQGVRVRARIIAILLIALFPSSILAQGKRAITIDDYFTQADLFGVAYSPKWVAYTEGRWQESTDDRKTDLWIVPTAGGEARRITADRSSARSPQWGPGATLYYLANRKREAEKRPPYDGKAQVWRVDVEKQTPSDAVTRVEGGIEAYELSRDGKSLYYLVHVDKIEHDEFGLRAKYSKLDYGHGQNRLGQIWKLDLASDRVEKIIDAGRNIREFKVSPNGQRVAMITTPDDKVVSFEGQSRADVWDAKTSKIVTVPEEVYRKQMPSPYAWLEHMAWKSTSDALAFGVIFDAYPAEIVIADLTQRALGGASEWTADSWLWHTDAMGGGQG